MFQLKHEEYQIIARSRSQNVILKRGVNIKYLPFVFSEHGVAMLSSVLKSKKAIQINIRIIDTFIEFRRWALSYEEIGTKLRKLEKLSKMNKQSIDLIIKAIDDQKREKKIKRKEIGFHVNRDKK